MRGGPFGEGNAWFEQAEAERQRADTLEAERDELKAKLQRKKRGLMKKILCKTLLAISIPLVFAAQWSLCIFCLHFISIGANVLWDSDEETPEETPTADNQEQTETIPREEWKILRSIACPEREYCGALTGNGLFLLHNDPDCNYDNCVNDNEYAISYYRSGGAYCDNELIRKATYREFGSAHKEHSIYKAKLTIHPCDGFGYGGTYIGIWTGVNDKVVKFSEIHFQRVGGYEGVGPYNEKIFDCSGLTSENRENCQEAEKTRNEWMAVLRKAGLQEKMREARDIDFSLFRPGRSE